MDATSRPNVLLICTDHWGGRFTRPAGHPVVMTPTIAQLARSGVCYSNAYSACPTCIPARRSLMTGLSARTHGDRIFNERLPMPAAPTLAQCFHEAGYQTFAVGKLHVHPQRDRIGFDEVILNEEGRHHLRDSAADDWELYLQDQGLAGQEYASGVCNNEFIVRPWHLPETCHPTNWAAREMCRAMHRRDPRKPALWYLSFVGPHQPMWPLQSYLDLYRDVAMDPPVTGAWSAQYDRLPYMCRRRNAGFALAMDALPHEVELARRAFYATITHIDHQIRVVIGYLVEQGLLANTIIVFTSDHGEMLGDHQLWTKAYMYDGSAKVPLLISLPAGDQRLPRHARDSRLVELRDIMPTLLELCGLPTPAGVEGVSLLSGTRREYLYGEHYEGPMATRMIRDGQYKLIYYPAGNVRQLFDLAADPQETRNLAGEPAMQAVCERLEQELIGQLYGDDLSWIRDGRLVGFEAPPFEMPENRKLSGQRGLRFM